MNYQDYSASALRGLAEKYHPRYSQQGKPVLELPHLDYLPITRRTTDPTAGRLVFSCSSRGLSRIWYSFSPQPPQLLACRACLPASQQSSPCRFYSSLRQQSMKVDGKSILGWGNLKLSVVSDGALNDRSASACPCIELPRLRSWLHCTEYSVLPGIRLTRRGAAASHQNVD